MEIFKNLTFVVTAFLLSLLLQPSSVRAEGSAPIHITFQKCFQAATGTWEGTVAGEYGEGDVSYVDLPPFFGTKIQHFSGQYTVITGGCSFTALATGNWNTQTGQIVLNGVVTEDSQAYAGSQFHVRAVFDGGNCSYGTMTITPRQSK
jgi:hypothetical protein